ncbi:MAG: low molecular weight phosphotyrosine protein phosphatase [Paracoccaceae bacterium]|nr:MAG: low molecular weight phosphotyrosine protein phosphatase [Paracoccaceae bacterium]
MAQRILFVCLGNICRSPTAEGVFRTMAARAGLDAQADSAGTGGWHRGEPPHPETVATAARRGYDLSSLRARQVVAADFGRFDLIIAMDGQNLRDLARLAPPGAPEPRLLLPYAPQLSRSDLPDPWYTGDFEETLDLVEAACAGLIDRLR